MIKNFLDADEDDSLITKQSVGEKPADADEFEKFAAPFSKIEDEKALPEIHESENISVNDFESGAAVVEPANSETANEARNKEFDDSAINFQFSAAKNKEIKTDNYEIFSQSPYQTESSEETIRKSGLAYSAAIILLGSIIFTLILGWFADLLFGTSPWGKVGGIVLGSIIGFIQFFRTTSQILQNKD